jgi:predicted ferric reductase
LSRQEKAWWGLLAVAGVNLGIIMYFWAQTSGQQLLAGGEANILIPLGRLSGLLATLLILGQMTMISRVRLLEQAIGFDRVTRWHRLNGESLSYFIIAHPIFLTIGYAAQSNNGLVHQFLVLLALRHVTWALIAWILFLVLIVMAAVRSVRRKLSYEQWYFTHLLMYVAILLVFWHQVENGADFGSPVFRTYWEALYILAFGLIGYFRFSKPLWISYKFRFRVAKVERVTPSAVSVFITGRNLQDFHYNPGQFVMLYFLQKGFWSQKHPFSISVEPGHDYLRLTIKGVGDFTRKLDQLKPGTPILLEGPYGIFTPALSHNPKILMIAGGSGITPLRAMLPEMVAEKRDVVMLYANQNRAESLLYGELEQIAGRGKIRVVNILSDAPRATGEKGYIDAEKIKRLVPDLAERDVYLCGPPVMMDKLRPALQNLGIPQERVYSERFAL